MLERVSHLAMECPLEGLAWALALNPELFYRTLFYALATRERLTQLPRQRMIIHLYNP
jgi:hypothetical protein